jgi:OHCU decarboxylase
MRLDRDAFVGRYGGIYENSAWVAEQAFDVAAGLVTDRLAELFAACVDSASGERKLALIRAHPDLAGKAAIAGDLSDASTQEQHSAGIDQCSAEELERFQALNRAYRDKFGFPFVMAVRNRNRYQIFDAFEQRLKNDPELEFDTAIEEIHKIARLRLEAL